MQGPETAIEEHIQKCFAEMKPSEREKYGELSQLLMDQAIKSGSSLQMEKHLDVKYVEKCQKDLKFPAEMLVPDWVLEKLPVQ